jgi:N-acyl-D-amino-acid deacylase
VIFDPAAVSDTATFEDPYRFPAGISHVLVNGELAVEGGVQTTARAGRVLRHQE